MNPHEETLGTYISSQARRGRRRLFPCETPGCSAGCAYAYGCHAARTGDPNVIVWPLVALATFIVLAGIGSAFA